MAIKSGKQELMKTLSYFFVDALSNMLSLAKMVGLALIPKVMEFAKKLTFFLGGGDPL